MHGALKGDKHVAKEGASTFLGTLGAAQDVPVGPSEGGSVLRRAVPTGLSDSPVPVTSGELVN